MIFEKVALLILALVLLMHLSREHVTRGKMRRQELIIAVMAQELMFQGVRSSLRPTAGGFSFVSFEYDTPEAHERAVEGRVAYLEGALASPSELPQELI